MVGDHFVPRASGPLKVNLEVRPRLREPSPCPPEALVPDVRLANMVREEIVLVDNFGVDHGQVTEFGRVVTDQRPKLSDHLHVLLRHRLLRQPSGFEGLLGGLEPDLMRELFAALIVNDIVQTRPLRNSNSPLVPPLGSQAIVHHNEDNLKKWSPPSQETPPVP